MKPLNRLGLLLMLPMLCACPQPGALENPLAPSFLVNTKWMTKGVEFGTYDHGSEASLSKSTTFLYFLEDGQGIARFIEVEEDTYFGHSSSSETAWFDYKAVGSKVSVTYHGGSTIELSYQKDVLVEDDLETIYTKVSMDGNDRLWIAQMLPYTFALGDLTYNHVPETKTLLISGSGDMPDYTEETLFKRPWAELSFEHVIIQEGVRSVGAYAFYEMGFLEDISLPKSLKRIGEYAFYEDTALSDLRITGEQSYSFEFPDDLEQIGDYAFFHCMEITHIWLPTAIRTIGVGAFQACNNLKSVDGLDGEKLETIGDYAFLCQILSVQHVQFGKSLRSIGNQAFYCNKAYTPHKNITFQEGLESIGSYAFSPWTGDVILPESIQRIGTEAFQGIISRVQLGRNISTPLDTPIYSTVESGDFFCTAVIPPAISSGPVIDGPRAWPLADESWDLHVPKGSSSQYQADPVWGRFRVIIEDVPVSGIDSGSSIEIGDITNHLNERVEVNGIVLGTSSRGYILANLGGTNGTKTSFLFVYRGANYTCPFQIGDIVQASGIVQIYGFAPELTDVTVEYKTGSRDEWGVLFEPLTYQMVHDTIERFISENRSYESYCGILTTPVSMRGFLRRMSDGRHFVFFEGQDTHAIYCYWPNSDTLDFLDNNDGASVILDGFLVGATIKNNEKTFNVVVSSIGLVDPEGSPNTISVKTDPNAIPTATGAKVSGTLVGASNKVEVGILYGKNPQLSNNSGERISISGNGFFQISLTGLECETTYYYSAYAVVNGEFYQGQICSFQTLPLTYEIDGRNFRFVKVENGSAGTFYIMQTELAPNAIMRIDGKDFGPLNGNWKSGDEVVIKAEFRYLLSALREQTGIAFRLPRKEEWFYAARGGALDENHKYSGDDVLDNVGWYNENSDGSPQASAMKKANNLGLFDMSGNYAELCQQESSVQEDLYDVDGVQCGGCWDDSAEDCKVTSWKEGSSSYKEFHQGYQEHNAFDARYVAIRLVFSAPNN